MIKIGLVGYGNWSKKIIKFLVSNQNYSLQIVYSSRRLNSFTNNSINFTDSIDEFCNQDLNCIYVATFPEMNVKIFKKILKKNISLILEKPISLNYKDYNFFLMKSEQLDIKIYNNIPNIYSSCFSELLKIIKNNYKNIKKINILEGANGPMRPYMTPFFDWTIHSVATIFKLFHNQNILKKNTSYLNYKDFNKYNTKTLLTINNEVPIKIISGNLFKKKIRLYRITLKNNNYFDCDFIKHEIFFNNKIIFKSQNEPLVNLFKEVVNNHSNIECFEFDKFRSSLNAHKFLHNLSIQLSR